MGYVSWLGKYDTSESVLVTLLRKAGAIFYTKTSVPQTLMVCETVNNITGRTVNPRNKNWSCGGSSGGEGAMVGIRGGVIGVGTDIGELKKIQGNISSTNCYNRWLYSCAFCIQLPLRYQTKPWPHALCQDGQQYGGPGDCA